MKKSPSVLVIGGGSTGTGTTRGLAMRGLDVTLVEKGNLTHRTTGRMHGLLYSGSRYVVLDQPSAKECIEENHVLRCIVGYCIEATGGLFTQRPEDSNEYFEKKPKGCREYGIPVEVLSVEGAREIEPYLAKDTKRTIKVPDGVTDPFRLCVANAASVVEYGARIGTHSKVTDVLVEGGEVVGVEVTHQTGTDLYVHSEPGEVKEIRADYVVNATGTWAGQIGDSVGVNVEVCSSKGVMTIVSTRQVDTVANRCRPKGSADIIALHETACILGMTDEEVEDPEDYPEEGWEVDLMIETLSELAPMLADARTIRSFWGVRLLYEPPGTGTEDPTDITREFFLLDHIDRDDLPGMTSTVGGKLTTYRMTAERTFDHVCEKLGVGVECRTADEPLPGSEDFIVLHDYMNDFGPRSSIGRRSTQCLGSRVDEVPNGVDPNPVACECEVVTRAEIQDALDTVGTDPSSAHIQTCASMGNCQGTICCHRMANEFAPEYDEKTVRASPDNLYQERRKGERHIMWGMQFSQTVLKHMLHATTMDYDEDPAAADVGIDFATFNDGVVSGGAMTDGGREWVADRADDGAFGGTDGDN